MESKRSVGVIGAGFSSLYAACKLALSGYDVTVFDKNRMVGGRAQTFTAEGFTFDMGPSWYWMPDIIDKMFEEIGVKRSDYYNITQFQTAYQVFWKNDPATKVPADRKELMSLFDTLEVNGGQKLDKFLQDAKIKYEVAKPLMELPGESLSELMKWSVIKNAMKLDVFKSVEKDVANRFNSDKARNILNFPVLFLGAMPDEIPSLYTLMNYADLELGTWYPDNGMSDLAKALEKIALENGVQFHMKSNVLSIDVEGDRVQGLTTSEGSFEFDFVLSGADYHFTEQHLLPEQFRRYSEKYWSKRKMAPSSLIYYLGMSEKIPGLEHHNLFFDEDLKEHGREIYENPRWPEKPLFYSCVPSKTDPKVAPEGKENVFLLMPIATRIEDTPEIREKYLEIMLTRMEEQLGMSIKDKIIYKQSFCIEDFKSAYNSFQGNAYGLANTLKQTANLKPKMRSKLKNMFFCGQLTVPGPGVPPALISGKIAANLIIEAS
ncbi:MAG: phytoene desaturase [Bacteroidetes bacterium]|nr:MAG: phytoene desaturase [Bacteroidota bacterium]TNF00622.1 MAG: phytoene desaturase [Bacteroidota bacterium]